MTTPVALSISAHDPLGGAGLVADMTTFAAFGLHGVLAVTALTAQHLDSVDDVRAVEPAFVSRQIDGILDEMRPDSLKTGLLASAEIVTDVAGRVVDGQLPAPVVDPVLVDGRGNRIVSKDIERAYRDELFVVARVITPNLSEASALTGVPLTTVEDVIEVADDLAALGAELVVVTGGGLLGDEAVDVAVLSDGTTQLLRAPRSSTPHVRGSGCTFAAALAAGLGRGLGPIDAAVEAKRFVTDRISESVDWNLGSGKSGPVSHRFTPFR